MITFFEDKDPNDKDTDSGNWGRGTFDQDMNDPGDTRSDGNPRGIIKR